ncbi:MAG: hypothetical protein A4E20_08865 [Nitrospira sp. SG-bin2]|jgi:hypothetical protein|uniref:hypothetical protein n=1 Tax=Nitrospira cf. moscoviensis SBR1015 TaxID=96242 RepID=UPI000A0973E1|nr:hypothetical protein [Nitrospira cf. moscoviensis SBR1015]OQW36044.1 MAG: hypothetical protein A4E20_08865 [Nitrospira sp. SG-bin2]
MATFLHVTRVLVLLAAFFPSIANAHGKVALEDDPCVHRVGGNLVHFNAYQPQYEAKGQYCTDIPKEGETFLVVDLLDPGLRAMPVEVRVVRGSSESTEGQTVAYWPPAVHPDGVVRGEAKLSKGFYKLIITPQGFSPSHYLLRVQQFDYGNLTRNAVGPLTILLLLAVMLYELSKSKRFWRWRVSSHS